MAHNRRSPALTEAYRERLFALRDGLEASAERLWPRIEQLDGSEWPGRMAVATEQAQAAAVRFTAGYLSAFASVESGRLQRVQIDSASYAGKSSDGRPLPDSFSSPLIGVLAALKEGKEPSEALEGGIVAARRLVGVNFDSAHRRALMETIAADERFDGWTRVLRGTCGACAGAAAGVNHGLRFPVHPGCFPAGVEVSGPAPVAASQRWYEGDLVELRFDGGGLLACTPNHPILTPGGWVAADKLCEGRDVIRSRGEQGGMAGVGPDDHERPALIEQVAEALRCAGGMTAMTMPLAPEDFHGDGTSGYVDVVAADSLLQGGWKVPIVQQLCQPPLCSRHAALIALTGVGHLAPLLFAVLAASGGDVSGLGESSVLVAGSLASIQTVDVASPADRDAFLLEDPVDRKPAGYAVPSRESLLRFAGEVETDKLFSVRRFPFRGHVFNLQSSVEEWYTANRTIVHNCQCVSEPSMRGLANRFPRPTGAEIFNEKSPAEQDEMLGPEAAEAVRSGAVSLPDLVGRSELDSDQPDWITQRPISALTN